MQLFRSEEDVRSWSKRVEKPVGYLFEPSRLWELARRWYDDRLRLDWRRRTLTERQAIFEEVGLTGEFWRIV